MKQSISKHNKMSKFVQPSSRYPELVTHLAKISDAAYNLYQLTKPGAIAKPLNITKQGMDYNVQKIRKGNNEK